MALGDGVVAPEVTRKVLQRFVTSPQNRMTAEDPTSETPGHEYLGLLTPREREVLSALGRGLGNAQIAKGLFVTEATVKSHVSSVLTKLQVTTRMQAAVIARETGLTD